MTNADIVVLCILFLVIGFGLGWAGCMLWFLTREIRLVGKAKHEVNPFIEQAMSEMESSDPVDGPRAIR